MNSPYAKLVKERAESEKYLRSVIEERTAIIAGLEAKNTTLTKTLVDVKARTTAEVRQLKAKNTSLTEKLVEVKTRETAIVKGLKANHTSLTAKLVAVSKRQHTDVQELKAKLKGFDEAWRPDLLHKVAKWKAEWWYGKHGEL